MDALDEFWLDSLYTQIRWARRAGYQAVQWRVNPEAMNILRRTDAYRQGYFFSPLTSPAEPERLFGYPIVIDPKSHGAVLEPVTP